jgi:hypothetical protein
VKIVGLVGPKRSGKDTAAAALVERRGFVRVGFADAVKDLALRINPVVEYPGSSQLQRARRLRSLVEMRGWDHVKDRYPMAREFLQELGTGVRDTVGIDAWTRAWARKVRGLPFHTRVVVPDVRFLNEAKLIQGWAVPTTLIRVTRPGLDLSDTHVSETEQAGIRCDVEITNDGTAEELQARVLSAMDGWSSQ